jgi:hypothetical protein
MAFKMKGNPMKRNFGLPGINNKSEGNTDRPDGRSASSAFQYKSPVKATYAEAIKKDPKLAEYIKKRKTLEKGSSAWNANQNKINAAYGNPKRYDTAEPKKEVTPKVKEINKKTTEKVQAIETKGDEKVSTIQDRKAKRQARKDKREEVKEARKDKREKVKEARDTSPVAKKYKK